MSAAVRQQILYGERYDILFVMAEVKSMANLVTTFVLVYLLVSVWECQREIRALQSDKPMSRGR